MAYSDNQWDKATAGRVYPKPRVESEDSPSYPVLPEVEAWQRYVRGRKAASKQGDSPLVKPSQYKSVNGF